MEPIDENGNIVIAVDDGNYVDILHARTVCDFKRNKDDLKIK